MATVASYALAVAGFAMMVAAVARTFGVSLKYVYTRPLLINALRTNGNHAEMLCKSSPDTYFGAVGAALKTGAMMRTRDPKVITSATVPAFDAAMVTVSLKWKQLLGKVKLAAMAAGGAVAIGLSKGVPPILVIILAVAVAGGYAWLYFFKEEIDRCMVRARAEILPEVDRAFIDGRYVFPPLPPS